MANYEVDNLEVNIKSQADTTVASLNLLIGKLTELKNATANAMNNMRQIQTSNLGVFTGSNANTVNLTKNTNNAVKSTNTSLTTMFGKITAGYFSIKQLYGFLTSSIQQSVGYTENLNLFTVAMGNYYEQGMFFQRQMNQMLGTNMSDTLKYQGIFMSMATSMGVANKQAYMLSENFTKLALDLSSLYNISIDDANTKIKGAIAGQAEPLRSVGIDITEASLRPIAESLGIDESVRNMTQAEKVVLRYIAIMQQAKNAQGDFARTIESPANQFRVMNEQLSELQRAFVSTFMNTLGSILPYINGFIMALKEVFVWLGALTGYDPSNGISTVTSGISDDLDNANESASKLQQKFQSFDEINLAQTPTSSSSGGGTSIDPRLLGAMSEYDNLMGNVQMKANKIRDDIMEWLGFTKVINPLTGEVSYQLKEGWTNLEKIVDIAKLLIGIGIAVKIVSLIGKLQQMKTVISATGLLGGFKGLFEQIRLGTVVYGNLGQGILQGTKAWISQLPTIVKVGVGVTGLAISLKTGYDSMKNLANGSDSLAGSLVKTTLSIGGATASGALLGSTFGPIGTIIGGIVGFVGSLTTSLVGYFTEAEKVRQQGLLFDGQGVPIEDFKNQIIGLTNEITKNAMISQDLFNEYDKSKTSFEQAAQSVQIFVTKLASEVYKATAEDVEKLNTNLDNMTSSIKVSGEAFTNSTIAIIDKLKEQGIISKQTADTVVASAIRKAQAEGNYVEAYTKELKDLSTQLKNGQITQQQYQDRVSKLNSELKTNLNPTLDTAKTRIELFTKEASRKIDLGSYGEVESALSDINSQLNTNIGTLKTNRDTQLTYIEQLMAYHQNEMDKLKELGQVGSETYREHAKGLDEAKKAHEGVYTAYTNSTNELSTTVARAYQNMLDQINSKGITMKNDTTGIVKKINEELDKIKANTNLNITASMPDGYNLGKIFGKNFSDGWKNNSNINFSYTSSGNISYGTWSAMIKAYATGGFPEDGLFFANSKELVGQFSNGKTAVANNSQIIEGIKYGVQEAMLSVMSRINGNTNSNNTFIFKIDASDLVDTVIEKVNERTRQTGRFALMLPN